MGDRRVGIPQDPNSTAGIVVDAGEKTLDLIAPAGINVNGAPLASSYAATGHTHSGAYAPSNQLAAGEAVLDRFIGAHDTVPAVPSGFMVFSCFTAQRTETITQVRMATAGTAAAATPTLCRIGVYSLAANDDATLIASTPNDTTLFAAAGTKYTKALSASFVKTAGQRYAVAQLIVSAAAMPTFMGYVSMSNVTGDLDLVPHLNGSISGLSDLLGSFTAAQIGASTRAPQAFLLP